MAIRYGVSPWTSAFPASRRPAFPKAGGDVRADVVIVGAGLTGCAAAYALAVAGMRPLVIDAARIGVGATAASAGLLLPDPGPAFRDLVRAHGLRAAKRAFASWRRAALDAAALLRRLNIHCGLEALDVLVTADQEGERELRREYGALDEAGFDLTWLTERHAHAATRSDAACAIRQSGAFSFDPYRACVGLARAAQARGAIFFEQSPVTKVKVTRTHVEVVTARGVAQAATVIVTTGAPAPLYAPLQRHFSFRDACHVLTDALPAAMRRQVMPSGVTVRDSFTPPHRVRWTADHRLLVSGAERAAVPPRLQERWLHQWTFELMYELLKMYPAISGLQPAYAWHGRTAVTRDGLPYVGPHRNYPRHLFALGGTTTDSATSAFLAARILLRLLEDEADPADDVFGFTR